MAATTLRKDEGIGLGVAVLLHVGVLAALLYTPRKHDVVTPPERIQVTISDQTGLTSTAPKAGQAAPDKAPEQGEAAPEPAPVPAPIPAIEPPAPAPRAVEKPQLAPSPHPEPKPVPRPEPKPRPVAKAAAPRPEQKPEPHPQARPEPKPRAQPRSAAKPQPRHQDAIDRILDGLPNTTPAKKAQTPPRKSGASAFDEAFKNGTPGASAQKATGTPASAIGPEVRSGLSATITRQLKPNWKAPQGPESDQLVTYLAFALNRDGSLAGKPTVVRQSGITDTNRNQAALHAENAIRAVELAAPFHLPPEYYDAWKRVSSFKFDRRLSQ